MTFPALPAPLEAALAEREYSAATPVQAEVQAEIDTAEGRARPMVSIERFAFYDIARKAYAVIQTGERRFYGCFMLRKGVIGPEE